TTAGAAEDEFRSIHLIHRIAAKLTHPFENVVHAVDVTLTQQTTVGVDGQCPADLDVAIGNEILGFARTAEAVGLELVEDDGAEVLIDHRHINVPGPDAGRLPELPRRVL